MYDLKERFFILALIPDSLQMDVLFFFLQISGGKQAMDV